MTNVTLKNELEFAIDAVQKACTAIMNIYHLKTMKHTYKMNDKSPVTQADLDSNTIISQQLFEGFSYPVLSEENQDNLSRLSSEKIWVLDPLDGTKEFIAQNGEFTINLALIENGHPVLGIIAYPVKNYIYYATKGQGAYLRYEQHNTRLTVCNKNTLKNLIITVSRSHLDTYVLKIIQSMENCLQIPLGSAIKYCAIAEGRIDASIRKTPLHEWDIAAADCIVQEAGGIISNFVGERFQYNKKKTLIDEGVLVSNQVLHAKLLSLIFITD